MSVLERHILEINIIIILIFLIAIIEREKLGKYLMVFITICLLFLTTIKLKQLITGV